MWDMEDMFGTSKEPHRILKVVGTIKLDDFIREFDTCTIVVGVDLGAHDTMNIQHLTNRIGLTIYKNESNEN